MDQQELKAIGEMSVETAANWQNRANVLLTEEEKGIQEQMQRLLSHPTDKVVLTRMIDQSFRSHNPARVADQINSILRRYGVPDFFSKFDRLLVQMFLGLGRHFPALHRWRFRWLLTIRRFTRITRRATSSTSPVTVKTSWLPALLWQPRRTFSMRYPWPRPTRTSGAKNRSKNAMRSSPRWPWPCGVRAAI